MSGKAGPELLGIVIAIGLLATAAFIVFMVSLKKNEDSEGD